MTDSAIFSARQALAAGQPATALAHVRARLAVAPADIDALEVAAMAADALGDSIAAERDFRRILALDPTARWARTDLARLLLAGGRPGEAEAVLREALAIDTDHADAHALFGALLAAREALVEAGYHLERAVALAGPHPDLLVNLGRTLLRRGETARAAALAEQAERAAPRSLAALILAADVAEQRGDRDAAARWLDRAEPIARGEGRDILLARATLLAGGADWQRALALLDAEPVMAGSALLLRGRLRERAGRPADAWADFAAGKRALARPHDRAAVAADLAALGSAFRRGLPVAALRRDVPQPIFLLGAPRSGTTMTEQLLAAHSGIRAGGELPFVAEMRDLAARLLGEAGAFPGNIGALNAADRHHIPAMLRDFYLGRAERYGLTAPGAAFFTDKMPLNEIHLPLIRLAFPQAPLVLVRRDPRDILVSAMGHDMTHGFNAFYDAEDAAHHLAAIGRLVAQYRETLGIAPYRFLYEDFVRNQAGETARLMASLGLKVEPAQAVFHTLDRHAPTPSYAQVREPLHGRSIGRWRAFSAQLTPCLPVLAELIREGGYDA